MNPTTMRRLATGVGIVSLVLAVAFTFMLINRGIGGSQEEQVTVVVPTTAIHQREALDSGSGKFKTEKVAKATADPEAVHSTAELDGLYALYEITPNTPVVRKKNADTREEMLRALNVLDVRPGYRAYALAADRLSVISGALKPGDTVDVLAAAERNGITFSRVALKGVKVLLVGSAGPAQKPVTGPDGKPQPAQPDQNVATTVTLELSPEQSRDLFLAQQKGKIQLVLCSADGAGNAAVGVTSDEAAVADARRKANQIERVANGQPVQAPVRVTAPIDRPRQTFRPVPPINWGGAPAPAPPASYQPLPSAGAAAPAGGTTTVAVRGANPEHVVTIIRGDAKTTQTFQGN
jgi:Flp pilus assembly protein CpaB